MKTIVSSGDIYIDKDVFVTTHIPSILLSHSASAAWLYAQFEPDRASPLVSLDRLQHYQRLFVAHLDGLLAGEYEASEVAASELARWKGHGELFAALYLALEQEDDSLLGSAWKFLQEREQTHFIGTAASVFLWLTPERAEIVLSGWQASDDVLLRQIALNALGLRRESAQVDVFPLFAHESPGLRAEGCRYAGRLRLSNAVPLLHQTLTDPIPAVREQAAIALMLCNQPEAALPELLAALRLHTAAAATGEGAASIRAERRAQHLARLFGHAIPFPCSEAAAEALLKELPPYLAILALAHHGNPALVPQLIRFMDAETDVFAQCIYKRRALWAMSFILGINPENEGLLADNSSLSVDWPRAPGLDQDTGLPEADAQKVQAWWAAHSARYLGNSASLLSGHKMTSLTTVRTLLENGMQAQRFAAAMHSCRLSNSAPWLDTRAPVSMQRRLWEQI